MLAEQAKHQHQFILANKGFKTSNIPLVNENSLPKKLRENPTINMCCWFKYEPERLVDLRKNRMNL